MPRELAAIRTTTAEAIAAIAAGGPFYTINDAARAIGASRGKVYQLAHDERLTLAKLGGRTLVSTESLVAYLQSAEPWAPSGRTAKAVASRHARAEAARREFAA